MPVIIVEVPYPPSANRIWRKSKGKIHRSEQYKSWLRDCIAYIPKRARAKVTGNFKITIWLHQPDKRLSDIDNRIKPTLDMAQAYGLIENDRFCRELHIVYDDIHTTKGMAGIKIESC